MSCWLDAGALRMIETCEEARKARLILCSACRERLRRGLAWRCFDALYILFRCSFGQLHIRILAFLPVVAQRWSATKIWIWSLRTRSLASRLERCCSPCICCRNCSAEGAFQMIPEEGAFLKTQVVLAAVMTSSSMLHWLSNFSRPPAA